MIVTFTFYKPQGALQGAPWDSLHPSGLWQQVRQVFKKPPFPSGVGGDMILEMMFSPPSQKHKLGVLLLRCLNTTAVFMTACQQEVEAQRAHRFGLTLFFSPK